MKYRNIQREEELKNKIGYDYFDTYDCTKIIGNIDFCVASKKQQEFELEEIEAQYVFWAEAKKGASDNKSTDEIYMNLIGNLRLALKHLAHKIEPKVFDYGFLLRDE